MKRDRIFFANAEEPEGFRAENFDLSSEEGRFQPSVQSNRRRSPTPPLCRPFERIYRRRRWLRGELPNIEDDEILELALTPVLCGQQARVTARTLMAHFGSIRAVVDASTSELLAEEGMTEEGLIALKVMREAALRMPRKTGIDVARHQLCHSLIRYLNIRLAQERIDTASAFFVDGNSHIIAEKEIGCGSNGRPTCSPRAIILRGLEVDAVGLVLTRNSTSGIAKPSLSDSMFTDNVVRAGKSANLEVLDHLIVSGPEIFFSFRSENLL